MSSSSAPDSIKVLDGKILPANKEEFKAALEAANLAAKKDADPDTEWKNALLSHYEHTTVTCPTNQNTFQILKK